MAQSVVLVYLFSYLLTLGAFTQAQESSCIRGDGATCSGEDKNTRETSVIDDGIRYVKEGVKYVEDFAGGTMDMWRAYSDMRRANTIGADKYFHARGNYEAARRGTGGHHAARIISDAREMYQGWSGRGDEDVRADQEANRWGRNGGDPNKYRPHGLGREF